MLLSIIYLKKALAQDNSYANKFSDPFVYSVTASSHFCYHSTLDWESRVAADQTNDWNI